MGNYAPKYDYRFSTWNETKFDEICKWSEEYIKGKWSFDRFINKRNIDANILYYQYIIMIEEEKDYLLFKMVWE